MKASDLFVKALEQEGVEYVFGIPGEENLDLLESLRTSSIRLVLTRHEQAAGFMAATYGRLTGKVGVCMSTLGPGATNLVTAAAYAQLGGMPILMITGQKPIKASKQGRFQVIDVVDMMRPITKYTSQIVSAERVASQIREAIRVATSEPPGAAHLELPEDIAVEEATPNLIRKSYSRRPVAEEHAIYQAVTMIEMAKHPLILVGASANRTLTTKMLSRFVDELNIPFISTQMGKGVIDETKPLYLGNTTLSSGDFVHRAIEHADLIINVGHNVVEKPPFFMRDNSKKVLHINFMPAGVDPVYFPQVEVIGDIANSIWAILERIQKQKHWDFSYFDKVRTAGEAELPHGCDDDRFPIFPQRLVADVRRAMPDDGIIALDNGVYKIWFARNYKAKQANTVLLDNALATMGAGLPSAIAAKLVFPNKPVIAICGDGGFMMNSQEMETAVRLKLHIIVLILRDDAYGMIKWKQANMNFANFGLDYGNPDFVKYAQAYGAQGYRIDAAAELLPLLSACINKPNVHLIDIPIDYSENNHILNKLLPQLSAKI